jgi:hypothetical protein
MQANTPKAPAAIGRFEVRGRAGMRLISTVVANSARSVPVRDRYSQNFSFVTEIRSQ